MFVSLLALSDPQLFVCSVVCRIGSTDGSAQDFDGQAHSIVSAVVAALLS
jgi:hypothetical protein